MNCLFCKEQVSIPCLDAISASKCTHFTRVQKPPIRKKILETAISYTCGARQVTHGKATDNFEALRKLWGGYLASRGLLNHEAKTFLTARDTAVMMTLAKIARIAVGNPKEQDHYIDAAAYMAIAAECEEEQ